MQWAFVDYENVGSLEGIKLENYQRIFVFFGPKNTKLKFGMLPTIGSLQLEIIGVPSISDNNVDFHLSFYLGIWHTQVEENIAFHIVSRDQGFNGLIQHVKGLGRECKRISPIISEPPKASLSPPAKQIQTVKVPLSDVASAVLKSLRQVDSLKRPRKRAGYLNWIKAHTQGMTPKPAPEVILSELLKHGDVIENENSVRLK
jgi:PIN domain